METGPAGGAADKCAVGATVKSPGFPVHSAGSAVSSPPPAATKTLQVKVPNPSWPADGKFHHSLQGLLVPANSQAWEVCFPVHLGP